MSSPSALALGPTLALAPAQRLSRRSRPLGLALAVAAGFALALAAPAGAAPEQVHLGLSPDAQDLVVSWFDAQPEPSPVVKVGGESHAGVQVSGPAAGFVYEARIPLEAGFVGELDVGGRTFPLRALPAALPPDGLRIVALGDMGTKPAAAAAVETILTLAPDVVLHAGDVSYAEGDQLEWKKWFDLVEPVAASAPWMIAPGNHDVALRGIGGGAATPPDPVEQSYYKQRFAFPGNELWYSFDIGSVHVVSLDTFSQMQIPAEQLAWLRKDLAAAADASWRIAFLHEPPYSSNGAHGSSARARSAFVDILEEGGVDLVLAAHDHAYERSRPLRGGEVVEDGGTVYVVTGGGGETLYEAWEEPQPEWSAVRDAVHHVLLLTITEDRIEGRAVRTGATGDADAFTILRAGAGGVPGAVVEPTQTPGPGAVAVVLALASALALARSFGVRRV